MRVTSYYRQIRNIIFAQTIHEEFLSEQSPSAEENSVEGLEPFAVSDNNLMLENSVTEALSFVDVIDTGKSGYKWHERSAAVFCWNLSN